MNMIIEAAESLAFGKWHARLACGHELILDADVTSPVNREVRCQICEGEDNEADPQ